VAALTRRRLLKLGLAAGATLTLPLGACAATGEDAARLLRSAARPPELFRVPLPIPPVLEPTRSDADADLYEITQREGRATILPGLTTTVWGYEGIFPGPTIVARSGRRIVVRQRNLLPVPVSTHLHGGVTPPDSDGHPTDLILPADGPSSAGPEHAGGPAPSRGSKDYVYPLEQRAATLWYHDHRMDFTGPQVYRGLAGFLIVRDEVEDALPLPKGPKDVPLMLADRAFGADGSLLYPSLDPSLRDRPGVEDAYLAGVLSDTILVNGAPWPVLDVSNTRYRFRILNASNARRYELELDPPPRAGAPFVQIGSDAGLLPSPLGHARVPISPGERYDLIVDFSQYAIGSRVTLTNRAGRASTALVMQFRVVRGESDDSLVPARLAPAEPLDPARAATTRRFRFHRGDVHGHRGWLINGQPFRPEQTLARPRLGDVEIWELRGNTDHPIHLHLAHFQILSRNGRRPARRDAGWKDTVNLDAGEEVRVIARFSGYRGRYVLHCHNLEHEDMAMMANVDVA
jgi:spore coat protein A, manganese oxidase